MQKSMHVEARQRSHALTFGSAAYGIVSITSSPLLEVGTRCTSVPGGHKYLTTPLRAANPTPGCARRPGTPGSHDTVNGCWGKQENRDQLVVLDDEQQNVDTSLTKLEDRSYYFQ